MEELDLDSALAFLQLPRNIGKHPEDGKDIIAGIGRFGGYVRHEKLYAQTESEIDATNIGLNHALHLLAEKKANPKRRVRQKPQGKILGEHPEGGDISALSGRYGPYVKWNAINASLGDGINLDDITLENAIELINTRKAKLKGGGKKKASLKKASAKKASLKKASPKK